MRTDFPDDPPEYQRMMLSPIISSQETPPPQYDEWFKKGIFEMAVIKKDNF